MSLDIYKQQTSVIQPAEVFTFDTDTVGQFQDYTTSSQNNPTFDQWPSIRASMFSFTQTIKNPNFTMRLDFTRLDLADIERNHSFFIVPFFNGAAGELRIAGPIIGLNPSLLMSSVGDGPNLIPSLLMNFSQKADGYLNPPSTARAKMDGTGFPYTSVGTLGAAYTTSPLSQFWSAFADGIQGVPPVASMIYRKYACDLDSVFISRDIIWKGIVWTNTVTPFFRGKIEARVLNNPQ